MSEWISVDERLPEEEQQVLVFWENEKYFGIDIEKITDPKDGNLWSCILKDYVKFWMPLPEPPVIAEYGSDHKCRFILSENKNND